MKRILLSAALVATLLANTVTKSSAAVVGEAQSGAWSVYETNGDGKGGRPLCGMNVTGDQGRSLYVKYLFGNDYLTLMAFKNSWRPSQPTVQRAPKRDDGSI
jgi:hypothetical protein